MIDIEGSEMDSQLLLRQSKRNLTRGPVFEKTQQRNSRRKPLQDINGNSISSDKKIEQGVCRSVNLDQGLAAKKKRLNQDQRIFDAKCPSKELLHAGKNISSTSGALMKDKRVQREVSLDQGLSEEEAREKAAMLAKHYPKWTAWAKGQFQEIGTLKQKLRHQKRSALSMMREKDKIIAAHKAMLATYAKYKHQTKEEEDRHNQSVLEEAQGLRKELARREQQLQEALVLARSPYKSNHQNDTDPTITNVDEVVMSSLYKENECLQEELDLIKTLLHKARDAMTMEADKRRGASIVFQVLQSDDAVNCYREILRVMQLKASMNHELLGYFKDVYPDQQQAYLESMNRRVSDEFVLSQLQEVIDVLKNATMRRLETVPRIMDDSCRDSVVPTGCSGSLLNSPAIFGSQSTIINNTTGSQKQYCQMPTRSATKNITRSGTKLEQHVSRSRNDVVKGYLGLARDYERQLGLPVNSTPSLLEMSNEVSTRLTFETPEPEHVNGGNAENNGNLVEQTLNLNKCNGAHGPLILPDETPLKLSSDSLNKHRDSQNGIFPSVHDHLPRIAEITCKSVPLRSAMKLNCKSCKTCIKKGAPKVLLQGRAFHEDCFRCSLCKTALKIDNFVRDENERLYCREFCGGLAYAPDSESTFCEV